MDNEPVLLVPAVVWRGGSAARVLIIGAAIGLCLGALAWLDSGLWPIGLIVMVATGGIIGVWMTRRMARFWPGAADLSHDDRVAVVRAVRTGRAATGAVDARLMMPCADYARGLRVAAAAERPLRWALALLLAELIWWPRRRDRLILRAEQAIHP